MDVLLETSIKSFWELGLNRAITMSMPSLENLLSLNVTSIQSSQQLIQPITRFNMVTTQSQEIIGSEDQLTILKPNMCQAMPVMFLKSNQKIYLVNPSPKHPQNPKTPLRSNRDFNFIRNNDNIKFSENEHQRKRKHHYWPLHTW